MLPRGGAVFEAKPKVDGCVEAEVVVVLPKILDDGVVDVLLVEPNRPPEELGFFAAPEPKMLLEELLFDDARPKSPELLEPPLVAGVAKEKVGAGLGGSDIVWVDCLWRSVKEQLVSGFHHIDRSSMYSREGGTRSAPRITYYWSSKIGRSS